MKDSGVDVLDRSGAGSLTKSAGYATDVEGRSVVGRQASSTHSTGDGPLPAGGEGSVGQRQRLDSLTGWGHFLNPLSSGGLFGLHSAPRTVLARADSFTGPPRRAMPFNLETDDADSVDSGMWSGTPLAWVWTLWRRARPNPSANRRGRSARRHPNDQVEHPIHAVHLGNRVTFLPTPLRNWWGRPNLMLAWFACSIYMTIIMVLKLGLFYFLATSLIIFPTAIGGACLGLVGSVRYLKKRHLIGSFDAGPAVEFIKLLALLAAMLTLLVVAVYVAIQTAWALRKNACAGLYNHGSLSSCNARDLCKDWSPCYLPAPQWLNGVATLVLGIIFLTASVPYIIISLLVFRRARAASHYLVDNLL